MQKLITTQWFFTETCLKHYHIQQIVARTDILKKYWNNQIFFRDENLLSILRITGFICQWVRFDSINRVDFSQAGPSRITDVWIPIESKYVYHRKPFSRTMRKRTRWPSCQCNFPLSLESVFPIQIEYCPSLKVDFTSQRNMSESWTLLCVIHQSPTFFKWSFLILKFWKKWVQWNKKDTSIDRHLSASAEATTRSRQVPGSFSKRISSQPSIKCTTQKKRFEKIKIIVEVEVRSS